MRYLASYLFERTFERPLIYQMLVCVVSGLPLAIAAGNAHLQWLDAIQERISVTSKALGAMRPIRMAGITRPAASGISHLRTEEIKSSRPTRLYDVSVVVMCTLKPQTRLINLLFSPEKLKFGHFTNFIMSHSIYLRYICTNHRICHFQPRFRKAAYNNIDQLGRILGSDPFLSLREAGHHPNQWGRATHRGSEGLSENPRLPA